MATMAIFSTNREPELGNIKDIVQQREAKELLLEVFRKGISLNYSEPSQLYSSNDLKHFLYKEPKVDIEFSSRKIPLVDQAIEEKRIRKNLFKLTASVVSVHAVVYLFFVGALDIAPFMLKANEKAIPVEVVFGVSSDLSAPPPPVTKDNAELNQPREALKTELQLPQLPKVVAVKDSIEEETEAIEEEKESVPQAPTKKMVKTTTPPVSGAKILSVDELLKLAEKESRRIGKKEQEGVKTAQGDGAAPSNRSHSPSSATNSLSSSALPLGTLEGNKFGDVKDAYSANVGAHIKRIWKIPETAKFNPDIDVIVKFDVNMFGNILGDVIIETSSGVREFDKLAVDVVKEGSPYPELPDELKPKMTLRVKLKPKDVKGG